MTFQTNFRGADFFRRYLRVALILLLALAAVSQPGCKSKKKLLQEQEAREAAARASEIENAKAALLALLSDDSMSLDEKERRLQAIKDKNIDDDEVQDLIRQVEAMIAAERARMQGEKEKEQQHDEIDEAFERRVGELTSFFGGIAGAASREKANSTIQAALGMFASEEAPVLIIINENRNNIDYDRPTTIGKYLNYLKDTGNNTNRVKEMKTDENGKITELILTKE